MKGRPVLGLTMGDPAGIGPELCARALREPSMLGVCVPVLFGDARVLKRLANAGLAETGCCVLSLAEWEQHGPSNEPLVVEGAAAGSLRPESSCGRARAFWSTRGRTFRHPRPGGSKETRDRSRRAAAARRRLHHRPTETF